MKQLINICAFYKANQDDGFGFDVGCVPGLVPHVEEMLSNVDANYAEMMKDLNWSEDYTALQLKRQLDEIIPLLNSRIYGQPTNPSVIETLVRGSVEIDFSKWSQDETAALTIFLMNVQWLESHGYLEVDNFNGMMFVSAQEMVA